MNRTIFSFLAIALTCSLTIFFCQKAEAQEEDKRLYLPLAFGNDTLGMRQDRMTRVYVAPKKILWSQGIVRNLENLLDVDNGQADLVNASSCFMQCTKEEDASIILDYGRELHGALKLVVGSGSAANFRMRVRLGESVSEACSEIENRLKKKVLPPNYLKQAAALMAIAGLMEPEKAA